MEQEHLNGVWKELWYFKVIVHIQAEAQLHNRLAWWAWRTKMDISMCTCACVSLTVKWCRSFQKQICINPIKGTTKHNKRFLLKSVISLNKLICYATDELLYSENDPSLNTIDSSSNNSGCNDYIIFLHWTEIILY